MFLKLLSYPRSLLGLLLFPLHTLFCSLGMIIVTLFPGTRAIQDQFVYLWTRGACFLFGVEVVVKGQENIPEGGFLFVFNHSSFFDVFAMGGYLGSFRFGAKIELFKIPVFGWAMRRGGILPIARDRREDVFKVYKEAEIRIRAGERFALAPEGTRQNVNKLGRFKSGPFIFAINAKAPILPVVIQGATEIMPKGSMIPNWGVWKRTVILNILPAVHAENYVIDNRPELQEKVRTMMLEFIENSN